MKRITAFITALIMCLSFAVPAFSYNSAKVVILDEINKINDKDELKIKNKAEEVSEKTGFNIVIVITDNIGKPKDDRRVVKFCDETYEKHCGINTDGALLLINDDTKYDYISTSGSAINYLSDRRIDGIWSDIDGYISLDNYAQAAYNFVGWLERYYNEGKDNNQQDFFGAEVEPESLTRIAFIMLVIAVIIAVCFYSAYSKKYKIEVPNTTQYILKDSLYFTAKTDTFVGNITTRIYSPRSSGRSSSYGGSHHSSTHRSSGGGRHGGGGHHR